MQHSWRIRPILIGTLALLAAGACSDHPVTGPEPELPADAVGTRIDCTVQVAAAQMTCASSAPAAGAAASVLLGGHGANLRLVAGPATYDARAKEISIPVALQNLLTLPLGTPDGTAAGAVDVHFFSGPTASGGRGAVSVANPDGTADRFAGGPRPFFRYGGPIDPRASSEARAWRFSVPPAVTAFTFTVFVETPLLVENGPLRWLLRKSSAAAATGLEAIGGNGAGELTAVGWQGTIVHHDGSSWARVPSPTRAGLGALAVDRGRTYAAGGEETVLVHRDGGWRILRTGGTGTLSGLWVSGDTIVAAGSRFVPGAPSRTEGLVVRSTDGGATWTSATVAPARLGNRAYADLWGGGGGALFLVGSEYTTGPWFDGVQVVASEGVLLRSSDGGATWSAVAGASLANRSLTGVGGSGSTVYVSGFQGNRTPALPDPRQGVILRSGDGGASWSEQVMPGGAGTVLLDVSASGSVVAAAGTQSTSPLDVAREDGVLLRSADGGASWTRYDVAPPPASHSGALLGTWVNPSGTAFAAGVSGTVVAAGGGALTELQRPAAWSLSDVWARGGTVVAVGEQEGRGIAMRSADGGSTWSEASVPVGLRAIAGEPAALFAAAFRLGSGAEPSRGYVMRSADQGASWSEVHSFGGIPEDVWASGSTVLVSGSSAGRGMMLRSGDGGASWAPITTVPATVRNLPAVHASGATIIAGAWRNGDNGSAILRSTDGGATWTEIPITCPAPGCYASGVWGTGSHWFVIGYQAHFQGRPHDGVILHSTDGGATWNETRVPGRSLASIDGADISHVFVTADDGYVIQYDGARWSVVTTPTAHRLTGIAAVSPDRVHAVGPYGTIITGVR